MHKGKAPKGMYQKKGHNDENEHGGRRMPMKMPMHNEDMDNMMAKKKPKKKKKY